MRLGTPHFTPEEMVRTSTPYLNEPDDASWLRMHCLAAAVLEPWREMLGRMAGHEVRLRPTSWYRSRVVNDAVGGHKNSHHLRGDAVDVVVIDFPKWQAYDLLFIMGGQDWLPVDQAIVYARKPHIHVVHRLDASPRRNFLVDTAREGAEQYVPWDRYQRRDGR